MLSAFVRAFKTADLRKKIFFTLAIIALFRLGSHIPAPGISYALVERCQELAESSAVVGLLNMFSGGALLQMSIFALGVMPYITAAIIVQLLTVVIPRFEALKKEGQSGQAKMTQYTRYLTIGLAFLQASTLVTFARNPQNLLGPQCSNVMPNETLPVLVVMLIAMVVGTAVVMWMGENVTEKGVGNGMSLLIFTAIASSFPGSIGGIYSQNGVGTLIVVLLIGLVIVGLVVFVEQCQRRIPVQYAKRMVGRRQYGGTSTYIPLKLNMANVIPIIFASSILLLPTLIAQFNTPTDGSPAPGWVTWVTANLGQGTGTSTSWVYMVVYVALIIFFAFFYVSVTYNPQDVADNMKKYGGFIPGIRAGRPTAEYLQYVITRITTPGAIYLAALALIPIIAFNMIGANQNFPFGGASVLIMVGVGLQTVKQIESQLQQHDYEGFLR